jgi:N-acetylglucosaminyldiphosphoundecaprenol N-acetyl-beta-D-mannosaminyltransferase
MVLRQALSVFVLVLTPGCTHYLSVPSRWFPFETHAVRVPGFGEIDGRRLPLLPYVRPLHRRISTARNFGERDLVAAASVVGLEPVGVSHVMPPFDHWSLGRRVVRPMTERLERSPLGGLGVSIIGVFRKPANPTIDGPSSAVAKSVRVVDVMVHDVSFGQTVDLIVRWAQEGSGGSVYTPNVDDVVKAHRMPDFRAAVEGARLRVPDGMGIVYGSRILGTPLRGTVTGRLLPAAVAAKLGSSGPGVAFFGGAPDVVAAAASAIRDRGGVVSAAISPPMGFQIGSPDDEALTLDVRDSGAGVVFVSLGAPRQALWMARHAADLPGVVLVGVGGAVDVLAGRVPTPPAWMTRVGLEWLYRLAHEPRRLARRYLVDDPRFFLWVLAQRISRRSYEGGATPS